MSLSFLYWFFLLCILIFGGWWSFRPTGDRPFFGWSLLIFGLFVIIGLKLFGFPVTQ